MSSIRLFFRGIKSSIKQNPVIYMVFLLFYIFSTIIEIYVSGKYSSNLSAYDNYDDSLTTFSVEYDYPAGKPFSEIQKAIEKNISDENVGYVRLRFIDEIGNEDDTLNEQMKRHWAIAYASNETEMVTKYLSGNGIKDIDVENFINSNNAAVIVESALTAAHDPYFYIQGSPYKVIKRIPWGESGINYHIVSYKSVENYNPSVFEISIKFNSISSFAEMNEISDTLSEDFIDAEINKPVVRDYNVESILSIGNILVYLVIVLSAVNFIYIFKYILEKCRRQYEIFFLCGCSKRRIVRFAVAEILLISVVQTLVGILLFHFAVKPLVVSLEPLLKYTFHTGLYFTVFGISVPLSFVVLTVEFLFLQKKGAIK